MATAGILGTGLIGTSVGLALREAGWTVLGWDPDDARRSAAAARGVDACSSRDDLIDAATDLIVLAGPPAAIVSDLASLDTDRLITDVAGVKVPVTVAGAHLPRFVPGHPMAGRETTGPGAASAALFRGASWVIVDTGSDAVAELETIVTSVGARPVRMSAAAHDSAVALVSHLPQVLAAALVREASTRPEFLELAAGSFRDLTRVAASDPDTWANVLTANGAEVARAVASFVERLEAWGEAAAAGRSAELRLALTEARDKRRSLAPPVVAVRIALADRPGELARVGHALEASLVDVRDLQLRHSPHGGGGILTLSVRPGESEALRAALQAEGLVLAD